jgi:hypothetical protein
MPKYNICLSVEDTEDGIRSSYVLPPMSQEDLIHYKEILADSATLLMNTPGGHQCLCDCLLNLFVLLDKAIKVESLEFTKE